VQQAHDDDRELATRTRTKAYTPRHRSVGGRLLRSRGGDVLRWLLPRAVVVLSHLIFRSCRIEFRDKEHEDRWLRAGSPIIFAGLHEGLMMLPFHFRDRVGGVVMVSASRDGDIIADTIARFGLRPVRGSSGHGGRDALDAMIAALGDGRTSAGVIVDGPRGPARVAKPGAVLLARATGLPIVPGTWSARRVVRFRSWDRTMVPLPFTRIVFAFSESLLVPPSADAAEVERLQHELTRRLDDARVRAEMACEAGRGSASPAPGAGKNTLLP
jgi:hypothetical protein